MSMEPSRVLTEEKTSDGLVGVFENMNDEFGVGEVLEAKDWVWHDAKTWYEDVERVGSRVEAVRVIDTCVLF
jgi:hypothetical protein